MENNGDKEKAPEEPKVTAPPSSPRKTSTSGKWIAVIIGLLVVIGVLGGLLATHYTPAVSSTGQSTTLSSQVGAISQSGTYSTNITATSSFKNMTVYYGDGSSQLFNYSGNNTVKVTHTYAQPGEFYIFADINYGTSQGYFLEPVKVTPSFPSVDYAYTALAVDPSTSSPQLVNNLSNIFMPGSHMRLDFLPAVGGGSYEIITQTLTLYNQSGMVSQEQVPYVYNINSKGYELPISGVTYAGLQSGLYTLEVNTTTAPVNSTQTVSATVINTVFQNFTVGQKLIASAGTSLSYNLSMVSMSYSDTNASYGKDTTVNYTASGTIEVGANTNVTVNYGTLIYSNATKSYTVNAGVSANINATYNITLADGLNLTYNVATPVNSTGTVPGMFYGSNSTFTAVNATVLTFDSAATNVNVTSTLAGTSTIALNNGQYDHSKTLTSTYYEDFPVVSKVTQQKTTETSFTNSEIGYPGGYSTLDPAIAYYSADAEVLNNALLQLDTYNGSSTSNFVPLAATYLPSLTNGGINTHYHNYTKTTPWGTPYIVNETPGQNYTFYINKKITFQDGSSLSAWDVMYSFTRTLLFEAGSPGTGGWVIAQYLLPGDYYTSNSFYNITRNITVDNATNSITFHFQEPMSPALVFQIFASSGTWIEPAAWFEAHGAGITWTPKGFQEYQSEGDISDYNSYVQNHVLADGPYMISYIIPGSQVTLVKNPSFVQPNTTYYKPASIDRINILYISSGEQSFLLLKSGQAQSAGFPNSYWNQTMAMVHSGQLQEHSFRTMEVYLYNFNLNVNESILSSVTKTANMPANLFLNPNVRKAFAYAFNYSEYYNYQVGNEIYNTTFMAPYAGMLPPGMLYAQTAQDLINSGAHVINANGNEPFQVKMAQKYWGYFENGTHSTPDSFSAMGLYTSSTGTVMYNGNPLTIPIMIPNNDPVDKAASTTWGGDIGQIVPGASASVVQLPLLDIYGAYAIPGRDPMGISFGSWYPDYPFPTDYLVPMGMPENNTFFTGPSGFTTWVVSGHNPAGIYNLTELAYMKQMLSALNNATSNVTNPAAAKYWFQKTNGMIVNSTQEVYTGEPTMHWIMSSKINGNDIINYQENVMIGGASIPQYNLLSYNSTT